MANEIENEQEKKNQREKCRNEFNSEVSIIAIANGTDSNLLHTTYALILFFSLTSEVQNHIICLSFGFHSIITLSYCHCGVFGCARVYVGVCVCGVEGRMTLYLPLWKFS